jgi:hypothetical protein
MLDYLTEQELRERTGFIVRRKQREFLQSRGIPFDVNGRGRILVERRLIEGKRVTVAAPNWDAIKAA